MSDNKGSQPALKRVVLLVQDFLLQNGYIEGLRAVEKQAGFDLFERYGAQLRYLRALCLDGRFEELETALQPIVKHKQIGGMRAHKILFEIHKQRFLELLSSSDTEMNVLVASLKCVEPYCAAAGVEFNSLCYLLTVSSFRSVVEYRHWTAHKGRLECFNRMRAQLVAIYPEAAGGDSKNAGLVPAGELERLLRSLNFVLPSPSSSSSTSAVPQPSAQAPDHTPSTQQSPLATKHTPAALAADSLQKQQYEEKEEHAREDEQEEEENDSKEVAAVVAVAPPAAEAHSPPEVQVKEVAPEPVGVALAEQQARAEVKAADAESGPTRASLAVIAQLAAQSPVRAVSFSPSGDVLAVGCTDKSLHICEAVVADRKIPNTSNSAAASSSPVPIPVLLSSASHHNGSLYALAFAPAPAASSALGSGFDAKEHSNTKSPAAHEAPLLLASGSNDRTVRIARIRPKIHAASASAQSLPAPRLQFDNGARGAVPTTTLTGHTGIVRDVLFRPCGGGGGGDSQQQQAPLDLYSCSSDRKICLWDLSRANSAVFGGSGSSGGNHPGQSEAASGVVVGWKACGAAALRGHEGEVLAMAPVGNDPNLLLTAASEPAAFARLWDIRAPPSARCVRVLASVLSSSSSHSSASSASSSSSPASSSSPRSPPGVCLCVASGSGTAAAMRAFTSHADGQVLCFDVGSGTVIWQQQAHSGECRSVSVSFDARFLVSGGFDQRLSVLDTTTGVQLASSRPHSNKIARVAWHPRSLVCASASVDRTVKLTAFSPAR